MKVLDENVAWCPKCFDALDSVEIRDEKDLIVEYLYTCFSCDKTFKITEFDLGKAVFGDSQTNGKEKSQ